MQIAFSVSQIFTGEEWLKDHSIIVNNGLIEDVLTTVNVDGKITRTGWGDLLLLPAFIDAQVYGAGKRLLAVYPDALTLKVMHDEFLKEGTVLFMPTVATNTIEVFKKCIDAVRSYWKDQGEGVYGLHLEGPWINTEKRGAHIKELIHEPALDEVIELLEYGKGIIKMITLAPEVCSREIVELISSQNIIIAAGHSNATYRQSVEGFNNGIRTVTHLFNAMSALQHRQPGLAGATLNHSTVTASIIPDGHHVDFAAIQIAKKIMKDRLFAITDAVTETTTGAYQHYLTGDKYECNGILSGSAISMYKGFINLVKEVSLSVEEAHRMCSLYPAHVLGCSNSYGRIAKGYKADFVVLNKNLQMEKVISKGNVL